MGTTKEEMGEWFDKGVSKGAAFMIVVCDTFDYEDYPVYLKEGVDVHEMLKEYGGKDMQRVMEVYSLKSSKEAQLAEKRAFHTEHFDAEATAKRANEATHLARHVELHKANDELIACYMLAHPGKLLRDTTLLELIEWSYKATKEPLCKR